VDATGTAISVAKTAQQIFDAKNADGSDADGNVFAAVNSLLTALNNNDQAGITTASTALKSADSYLNQQLAFYGEAENRVSAASDLAQKFQTQQQAQLSTLRDADIPSVALQLSQGQVDQQAALSAEANIEQSKNLFSYLG
jgi:flagellin-like hook-associated protein FlgL